jgi:hypothetical protein
MQTKPARKEFWCDDAVSCGAVYRSNAKMKADGLIGCQQN